MKVQFYKDKIINENNEYYRYYAAIERTTNGGKLKEHEVLFSACVETGIKILSGTYRRPSSVCVEITAAEFKEAAQKALQQMFNKFNLK